MLGKFISQLRKARYDARIERSLALYRRGEVRSDGLQLLSASHRIEIEWRARDVHPWDRADPESEKAVAFVAQCLTDTEAAIMRLFKVFPHVNVLQVRVLALNSDQVIVEGTVLRSSLLTVTPEVSIGMRLRTLGMTYHSAGSEFESLESRPDAYDAQRPGSMWLLPLAAQGTRHNTHETGVHTST
jgi:hypothetical protein